MNKKHVLCLVLSLLMLVSAVFPAGAFADDFFSEEPVFVEEQPFVEDSYFTEDTPSEEPAEDIGITEEQPGEEIFVDDFIEEPVDAIVEDAQDEDAVAEEPAFTEELIEEAADEAAPESAEETAEETEVNEEIMETVSDTESFEAGPTISTQPQSQSAQVGDAITFTVKATGSGTLSYQWYYRTSSTGNWTAGTTASAKTDKYKVTVKAKHDGYQYYVKVTDSKGSTDSNVITLTVGGTLVITSQPVNSETAVGGKAVFTVGATGVKTYQWQYKTATATKWTNKTSADGKTESISIKVDKTRYDYKYRCKLVGTDGKTYYTDEVQIVAPASSTFDSGDFTFLKTGDKTCTVKKYNGSAASVTVPETANSCTVVGIEAEAFMGNTTLKSIDLPDTITVIGARAFKGCTSLSEMK